PPAPIVIDPPAAPAPAAADQPVGADLVSALPDGWTFEHDAERTRARRHTGRATFWCAGADREAQAADVAANLEAAILDGLITAAGCLLGPSPPPPDAGQVGMLDGISAAQLAEDKHARCPKHGTFYQPHCWHCKRRRPDRPHKRASQG